MSDFGSLLKILVEADPGVPEPDRAAGLNALQTTDPGQILADYVGQHQQLAAAFDKQVDAAFKKAEQTIGQLRDFQFVTAQKGGMDALLPQAAALSRQGPLRNIPVKGQSSSLQQKLASLRQRGGTPPATENRHFGDLLNVLLEAGPDITAGAAGATPEANKAIGSDYEAAKKAISELLATFRTSYNAYKSGTDKLIMELRSKMPDIKASHAYGKLAHGEAEGYKQQIFEIKKNFAQQKAAYDKEVEILQIANARLTEELEKAKENIEHQRKIWTADLAGETGKLAEKQAELEKQSAKVTQLESEISQKTAALESKQQEVERLAQEVKSAEQSLQRAQAKGVVDEEHITAYRDAIEQFTQEFEELRQQSTTFRDEADVLRERLMKMGGYRFKEPEQPQPPPPSPENAHHRPYGKFDLMEHLKRAIRKDTKKFGKADNW